MLAPIYAFFAEDIGASIFVVSALATVFLISKLIFSLVVRKFGDTFKEKEYLLILGYLIRSIAWFSLVFVDSIFILFVVQAILGLGEAVGSPAFNAIFAKHLDGGKQIKEYAEYGIVGTLSTAIGTITGGYIVTQFGFTPVFIIMGTLAIVSSFGIFFKPRDLL